MAQDDKPPSFGEFDAKMRRIRSERDSGAGSSQQQTIGRTKFGAGLQVGIELVAGVIGGSLLGYALDRWLETAPLLLIVFFMLGAVAGTYNAYRWLRRFNASFSDGD
jgi:ATP synthase protein I